MYMKRIIDLPLKHNLGELPAILIEGAKAVGKTESCLRLVKSNYSLDNATVNLMLKADPGIVLKQEKPVLIDEWQYLPEMWAYIRHQVDKGLENGSILFTGSSIRVNARVHSGAGRIVRMKMRPFSIEERQMSDELISVNDLFKDSNELKITGESKVILDDYLDEIFKSGFPGIRQRNQHARNLMLDSYIDNIIDHDFEENGFKAPHPDSLRAWMKAYAAAIATPTKFQTIISAAMANDTDLPTRPTVNRYREALEILYIIDEVPAFLGIGKIYPRLVKSSKHFMLDPAIALKLLNITRAQLVNQSSSKKTGKFNRSFIGQLLESLVYQSLIVYSDADDAKLSHFRNREGTKEIDFILQKEDHLILFEVKADPEAKDKYVEHLNWFEEMAKNDFSITKVLLNTGPYAYTRQDNVHVIPIAMLGV